MASSTLSVWGFTRRAKYTPQQIKKIVDLKLDGMSIRKIAKELNMPFGSIHYILRWNGRVTNIFTSRPSNKFITRGEAKDYYDISDSQFDYYRGKYKEHTVLRGNVVYMNRDFLEERIIDKVGYKKRYE